MAQRPYCFVLMPFGTKSDAAGLTIDFDRVYSELIEPAIREAELDPIRADNEMVGGIIHKPMFERLVLCEYAVADLTMANANVYYELGVRHAVRPWSTVLLHSGATRMPFDVAMLRALPYQLSDDGSPRSVESDRATIVAWLREARAARKVRSVIDSPLFQLLEGFPDAYRMDQIAHAKTDVFRDRVAYAETVKRELAAARDLAKQGSLAGGRQAVDDVRAGLGPVADLEAGVLIDLFLSYRAVKAWEAMIALVDEMPGVLRETVMVQEQLGLALNRAGRGEDAERVLTALIERRGPSGETLGILGRVYKDRWEAAAKQGDRFLADGLLEQAIDAYRRGFEADWRDAYPGVNAVSLMECAGPPDPRRERLLPIITYAAERRIEAGHPDYWDFATLLELAVVGRDEARARSAYARAIPLIREPWEPETTAHNLGLLREARRRRGEAIAWADQIEDDLRARGRDRDRHAAGPGASVVPPGS